MHELILVLRSECTSIHIWESFEQWDHRRERIHDGTNDKQQLKYRKITNHVTRFERLKEVSKRGKGTKRLIEPILSVTGKLNLPYNRGAALHTRPDVAPPCAGSLYWWERVGLWWTWDAVQISLTTAQIIVFLKTTKISTHASTQKKKKTFDIDSLEFPYKYTRLQLWNSFC